MEGADIDAGFAQGRTDTADKAGLITVDDIKHIAFHIRLDLDAKHFDKARTGRTEQRSRYRLLTFIRGHRYTDKRVIIAFAVVPHFANIKTAFLGKIGRVHHVDRVAIGTHQTGQNRSGNRLLVQLCSRTFYLDSDAFNLVTDQLADQRTKLCGKIHIRTQFRCLFRRQAGHVERVGNTAIDQIVRHLFGNLYRDIHLCLAGRSAQVRCADQVGCAEKRVFLGRFLSKNVQRRSGYMAGFQRFFQSCFVDQTAACTVHNPHAGLCLRKCFGRQDIACLVRQRRVQGDEVRAFEKLVQRHFFNAHFNRTFRSQERIESHDLHTQANRAFGNNRTDITGTDQAQCLAGQLDTHEPRFLPLAGLCRGVGFRKLAGQREHHRNRMFRSCDAVTKWRVHHHNAFGGSGWNIDIVHPDTGTANHFQIGRSVQYFGCHSGR